ncbi:LPS-assembly protein LptD [Mucilaginibacter mali]|uniref:LPS-assembly protein LptD n=1 Tax=Mucilaginibacter mali TaxID=2740462 RepID=A0A7D4Q980_9SPHI|nr:putative LPS assembly protein LptD [Mucilaginibacter mali]QKJ29965.1 LPS-assembly protein LptD [Mucilaginibacter mali]
MKFIRLFFLLAVILVWNEIAAANKSALNRYALAKDTIIKLDSVRDRKLLRLKPKPGSQAQDTTKKKPTRGGKAQDTTKKRPVAGATPPAARDSDELTEKVNTTANDSTFFDEEHKMRYLYGGARVTYGDMELDADYIRIDETKHLIFASGLINPKTHRYTGRPISKMDKQEKPVTSDSLLVDYETKRGKVWNGSTEQDGNYISGGKIKKLKNDEVAYENSLLSTCDLPYPYTHFGIVITKGIAEKNRIISSLFYLEIEGVPLPIGLPFGFFPKPDSRASGFILPTFGEDQKLGFYLRNFGYYFGINDYVDVTTQGTLYAKGSYELNSNVRYTKLYKYQGSLTLAYGSHNYGLEGDPAQKDFNVQWSHSTSPNAHPGTTFSASVNAGTSSYYQNNPATTNYSLQQLTQNNLHSSIAYGKTWEGTPFNFTANLSHSQDLSKKIVTLELPSFSFNMSTISPFDKKDRVGEQKWYQKLTIGYSLTGTNKLNAIPENELFKSSTFQKRLQNGLQHQIPVGLNLNVLKYFQFNTSLNYNDRWYFQTTRKHYARGSLTGLDSMIVDTVPGFKRVGEYSLSAGTSTKVYSYLTFKNSKVKQIRDVITPSIAFNYRPDYTSLSYGFNQVAVANATVPYPASVQRYSIFDQSIYGGPSGGRSAGLSFSVDNTIEAKVRAKSTDTSGKDRIVPILQGLSFSTFYNFAADSFKLSPINFSGHTAILNQKVSISFGGVFDPYVVNVRDSITNNQVVRYTQRLNKYTFQNGNLPFLNSFNVSMGASLNPSAFKPQQANLPNNRQPPNTIQNMTAEQANKLALLNTDPNAYVDFNVPWNLSLNYSFNYNNDRLHSVISNTMQISGDLSITPKWKVQFSTNYDLKMQKFSDATSFSIYRDLHCWDLSMHWIPFGFYKSYSVDLKVKASILQDLKLSKRKDYYNNL